jgi:hypothetical protein
MTLPKENSALGFVSRVPQLTKTAQLINVGVGCSRPKELAQERFVEAERNNEALNWVRLGISKVLYQVITQGHAGIDLGLVNFDLIRVIEGAPRLRPRAAP